MSDHLTDAQAERGRSVRRVLWWVLVANWAVAGVKLVFGLLGHSASLTADGGHSFIDGASNIVGLVALSFASAPADAEHPYGHRKLEALAGMAIGVMVGVTAFGVGQMAISSLVQGVHPTVSTEMLVAMIFTLVVNITVTTIEGRLGTRLKSQILTADAQHTLSDVLVSLAVLASLGLVKLGWPQADGIVALLVVGFIGFAAWRILKEAADRLIDTARLAPSDVELVGNAVNGVVRVSGVRSRGIDSAIYLDLTVHVSPETPVSQAHDLAHDVESALRHKFPDIADVVVHIEPP